MNTREPNGNAFEQDNSVRIIYYSGRRAVKCYASTYFPTNKVLGKKGIAPMRLLHIERVIRATNFLDPVILNLNKEEVRLDMP